MKAISIKYIFSLPDKTKEEFDLKLMTGDLTLKGNEPHDLPEWARLENQKCPNCPLNVKERPYCPLALSLVNITHRFAELSSVESIHVEVIIDKKKISMETTAQRGISALMGLIAATSNCPYTNFFKPMARFHLPFAETIETTYRAASMYLMAQYLKKQQGKPADLDLSGLITIYENIEIVNKSISRRLLEAAQDDSTLNALTMLDVNSKLIPFEIDSSLEKIRPYFKSFMDADGH